VFSAAITEAIRLSLLQLQLDTLGAVSFGGRFLSEDRFFIQFSDNDPITFNRQ
jgi:hypothetical protein